MRKMYEQVVTKSGWSASIQASSHSYCHPRQDRGCRYSSVEIGFPSEPDPLITPYAEDPNDLTGTVYGWVPAEIVTALLVKHGDVVSGEVPPLYISPTAAANLAGILESVQRG